MSEWIKVENGLPSEKQSVLITVEYGDERMVIAGFFHSGKFVSYRTGVSVQEDYFSKVIAWQSLPEPYQDVQNVNCTQKGRE